MDSSKGFPAIWRPTGRSSDVNPQLIDKAGTLARLKGAVKLRLPPNISKNASLLSTPAFSGIGEAGIEDVGITSTSTFSKASNICCLSMCRSRTAF